MKKSTKYELPHDKPLLTVTVGEFAALMAAIINEGKAVQDTGTTARGLGGTGRQAGMRTVKGLRAQAAGSP